MSGGKALGPRLEAGPQKVRSRACWGRAGPMQPLREPTPVNPGPAQPSCAGPCPHQGLCRGHAHCWASNPGPTIPGWSRSSLLHAPGFPALACPGAFSQSCCPKTAACQGQGRGRRLRPALKRSPLIPRPSAPGTTEARSPPPGRDLGCLPLLLPRKDSDQGGSSQASRPCQGDL